MLRFCLLAGLVLLLTLPVTACGSSSSPAVAPLPVVDMIVGTRRSDAGAGVFIFRDVLHSSAIAADVVLDNAGSGIDNGGRIDVWNDTLVVSNRDSDQIRIFRDIPTLMSGDAPDVVLSGFNLPNGVTISAAGDLYVSDRQADQVDIYRDITTLVTGDGPDATLNTQQNPVECVVAEGRLFVASRGNGGFIQAWDNAAGLTGGEAAAAEVPISEARRLAYHNGVLWVRGSYSSAVFGFSNPASLMTGDTADHAVFGLVPTDERGDFDFAGNTMWLCNQWQDSRILARVNLSTPLVTEAEATVHEDVLNEDALYDVRVARNVLFTSVRNNGFVLVYENAAGFETDDLPDLYVFDARMDDVKEIRLIER